MKTSDIRITVLRGGPSAERAVSLRSGAAVAEACRRLGYRVHEADISPDDLTALTLEADVVFPVLHGAFGEDGGVQKLLQRREIPYVGSDAPASRLAMDKDLAKHVWRQAGLPTAPWRVITDALSDSTDFPLPAVIKPACEGSSVGVTFCETEAEIREAILGLMPIHGKLIVEPQLTGPELTVGILLTKPLPVVQIKPATLFYDYEAKYARDDTQYLLEPEIDEAVYEQVQRLAIAAFRCLGCRDYGRVDFIVDATLGPQLLEINTIPGFTSHSLLPKAARHAGIGFDRLVDTLVQTALQRNG